MTKLIKKNKTLLEDAVEDFMQHCSYKDLRITTMKAYEQSLKLFLKFLEDDYNTIYIEDVKREYLKEYIDFTKERGKYSYVADESSINTNVPGNRSDFGKKVSLCTVNSYLLNIKTFFNWAKDEKIIKVNPVKGVANIKHSRKQKEDVSTEEFNKLLKVLDLTLMSNYRDYVLIQLLLDTGMRIGECLSLTIHDIDFRNRTIFISGEVAKGRKDRYVFFSPTMQKILSRWINYKDRYMDSELIFCTKSGNPYNVHMIEKNMRVYLKKAGITKQITPHTLRNNFAKRFLMSGGDIYTLSKILGHSSVRVTEQAYLDLNTEDIRKQYLKHSPLENMRKK